jgi:hypothetical protein
MIHGVIDRIDHAPDGSGLWLREFKSGLQWRETVGGRLLVPPAPVLAMEHWWMIAYGEIMMQGLKSLPRLQTLLYSYCVLRLTGSLPQKVSCLFT